eukprot:CAMPEP_0169191232 /NCGR_PEP_ID=MMETSP1016-20121227/4963_1 /TAXON_ID=342587 /ORGANISM="Karlodinium micrum, Strain CCMP2283" /LENGTH=72 /DNA_ID=CAMNT_0009267475 /DNA_START=444 /DNA_END=662 /DNA_ORIENTATION=-
MVAHSKAFGRQSPPAATAIEAKALSTALDAAATVSPAHMQIGHGSLSHNPTLFGSSHSSQGMKIPRSPESPW